MSVKPLSRSEIQGFSKGLATDVNPLNSKVDTTVDEVNFELHQDGTRSRRLGLNKELNGAEYATNISWSQLQLSSTSTYLWEGVNGDPATKFLVVQVGNVIRFFDVNAGLSGETLYAGTIELPLTTTVKMGFGVVEGYLSIVTGTTTIWLVSHDAQAGTFQLENFRIRVRDFFGIEETIESRYEIDKAFRGPINWQHYYNLYNQGWATPRKDWQYGDPPPVDAVYLGSKKLPNSLSPSNVDTVWSGLAQKPVDDKALESFEGFHYRQFEAITGADTKAAKGYFIIDAFNRGSSRADAWLQHRNKYPQTGGLAIGFNPPQDATSGGPTSIASHAGRLFYSGCSGGVVAGDKRSPNYNNYVFFTQLITSKADFSKCYQEGDPTSRENSDIVDTDGGHFAVSNAINIHSMFSMGGKLFLIAENGVWAVSGGGDYGFAATNYMVTKVSTFGGVPGKSFVSMGDAGFFWGYDGIYSISRDQYGEYKVDNLSKKIIHKFFTEISSDAKLTCQGFVDKQRNQIRWVYTEGPLFSTGQSKELILDLNFQAFYPFTIGRHQTNNAYVISGIQVGDFSTKRIPGPVVHEGLGVYHNGFQVETVQLQTTALDSSVKYVTVWNNNGVLKLVFAEYNGPQFQDWTFTGAGTDAAAYMETNAFTGGDFSIKKQVPYLTMAFAETEKTIAGDVVTQESSCIGKVMWSFSHLARSGKWSRKSQLYRKSRFYYGATDIDNGFTINVTKTKIRGIGRSLALRVETEPLKDCHIYGWNLSLTSNSV